MRISDGGLARLWRAWSVFVVAGAAMMVTTWLSPENSDAPSGQAAPVDAGARAWYVAPTGRDGARGSLRFPFQHLQRALDQAQSGDTIYLRRGSYHQSAIVQKADVTIRPYHGERVWFDGSVRVRGFDRGGPVWIRPGWTAHFDHSPTFNRGAPDGSEPNWQWINPRYPMAAWPDQVWIDGRSQRQVASPGSVRRGTFAVDYSAHRLILGTNPAGHVVRASALRKALSVRAPNVRLIGFGVRRYADSVPVQGAVTLERPGIVMRNVDVIDNATSGILVHADHIRLVNVRATDNGLIGIHGPGSYDLLLRRVFVRGNNREQFNQSPVAGGVKITKSRDVRIRDSTIAGNNGTGLWLDESTYGDVIVGNRIVGNAGHGVSLEISDTVVVANNLIADNQRMGLKVNNTGHVAIWNNAIVGNSRAINAVQDKRLASDPAVPGHDPRRPFPDPSMSWAARSITVKNNVLSVSQADCYVCVRDATGQGSIDMMQVSTDGNVYEPSPGPSSLVMWGGYSDRFMWLPPYRTRTGNEMHGRRVGATVIDAEGHLQAEWSSRLRGVAQPLPAAVADVIGSPAGVAELGVLSGG